MTPGHQLPTTAQITRRERTSVVAPPGVVLGIVAGNGGAAGGGATAAGGVATVVPLPVPVLPLPVLPLPVPVVPLPVPVVLLPVLLLPVPALPPLPVPAPPVPPPLPPPYAGITKAAGAGKDTKVAAVAVPLAAIMLIANTAVIRVFFSVFILCFRPTCRGCHPPGRAAIRWRRRRRCISVARWRR